MSRVLDWDITVSYQWTAGAVYGHFLGGLKEEKIFGVRCESCSTVYCPPGDVCLQCFTDMAEQTWLELEQEGEVVSFTKVMENFFGERPSDEYLAGRIKPTDYSDHPLIWPPGVPYAMALIRMKGADTAFLHLVRDEEDLKKLRIGAKVRPVWKQERSGYLLDIDQFQIIG